METLAWATIRNLDDGRVVPRVRRATIANHTRVANAKRELRLRGTIADFIMSCSHAMDNVVAEAMRYVDEDEPHIAGPEPQVGRPPSPPVPPPPPPVPPPPPTPHPQPLEHWQDGTLSKIAWSQSIFLEFYY